MTIATGQDATADDINNLVKLVRKTADEVVNNSTSLQNDNHLLFALGANEIWAFKIFINFLSGSTPGFKLALTVPSGATLRAAVFTEYGAYAYLDFIRASGSAVTDISGEGITDGTNNVFVVIEGYVVNGSNAGNLQLQWAQSVANASDTTVKSSSYLVANKLA